MDKQAARTAEQVTSSVAQRAGTAVQRGGDLVQRAGTAVERHGTAAAPAVGAAVGGGVERATELTGSAAQAARSAVSSTRSSAGTFATALAETVTGVLDEPATRGGAAVSALRGQRVGPPVAVRRWPWALGAALIGAGTAAGIVLVRRRLEGQDAPDAQEPHELRAVVDVPAAPTPGRPTGAGGAVPTASGLPAPPPPA